MDSMYIHIPFCKKICSYCDFCKVVYHGPWVKPYIDSLEKEIIDRYNDEKIKNLYIGGGTPSALTNKELVYLLEMIKNRVNINDVEEYTIECNLNDISESFLNTIRNYGINRISIGIESFNSDKLKFMERYSDFEDAKEKMKLARDLGFSNINVDLIYGIPGETLKDLKKDLDLFLKLKPDHISTYSLIIEDNTKIGISKMVPISEDLDAKMYEYICEELDDKGYEHYEISNFCRKNKRSRYNMNTWNNNEYYGFGVGASGYTFGVRYDNNKSLTGYIDGKWRISEHILNMDEKMDNELMLGLRKIEGINLGEFYKKYNTNIQEVYDLKEVLKNKELIFKDDYLYVNPVYLYVMNEILIKIL